MSKVDEIIDILESKENRNLGLLENGKTRN